MPHHLVPIRHAGLALTRDGRAVAKRAKAEQRWALEVRAEDASRRYIARGRMRDIRDLTEDALQAGGEIADRLAYEASARPFFAHELTGIASTGARGLKGELVYFIEEGH